LERRRHHLKRRRLIKGAKSILGLRALLRDRLAGKA
jgi:hypothetical protein